jgi:P-type Ca2+ transporter type 2C
MFPVVRIVNAATKGRARFKVEGLYRSDGLKVHLEVQLAENGAIDHVSASSLTGNVLVRYNSGNNSESIAALIRSVVSEYLAGRSEPAGTGSSPVQPQGEVAQHPTDGSKDGNPPSLTVMARLKGLLPQGQKQREKPWHVMETDEILAEFGSEEASGLTTDTVKQHFQRYGPNVLPEAATRSKFSIFFDQFKSLPVGLLGVAAGISVLTGGVADAVVILSVVAINGVIGYVTESEAERTIHSLQNLVKPVAHVLRDSTLQLVRAEEVVPGDILVLRPGSSIAADGRLLQAQHLSIDESVLTGESLPVIKTANPILMENVPIADRLNMVFKATVVTGGQGFAVVVATGKYTEVGRLQTLLGEATSPETPMERQLNRLGDQLVLISGAACGIVFVIGLLRGYGFIQMLKTAISLAVAAVPEGLPAVATTTLALGIRNMRKHRVLIRQLEAVETLGSVQTICFDKTGTITLNRMSVIRIHTGMKLIKVHDGQFAVDHKGIDPLGCEELLRLIQTSVLCNETKVGREKGGYVLEGSPTENALIHLAIHASVEVIQLREQYPLLQTNYRSENRQFMGTLHENGDRRRFIALKGSPNEVLAMCDRQIKDGGDVSLTEQDRDQIELENERMAGDALRVLGVAYAIVDSDEDFGTESGFIWLGLIGMADPIRAGVKELIAKFHHAGIDTVMITGDQSPTAYAIGKEMDLSHGKQLEIMDSTHLEDIEPDVIRALSERIHVYARVSPAHKLKIVQALQGAGKVVAMTGDGINDGPALKAADIGIAMGAAGTDMAREVADVILEDDNLETMIIAVRDGRTIYKNIRKALHFLLATNFSEIMVMFLTVAAGVGSPLNAMQLLWINLMSDIFPGLALAMEAPEPDVLEYPPRQPDEPIVKTSDFKRLTFESATMSVSALGAYAYGITRYGMGAQAGTLAFHSLTTCQLLHAFSCRSETHSIFSKGSLPPNKYLNMALGGSFVLQLMTMLVPGLRQLLGITPIGIMDGLVIGGTALAPLLINEATKNTAPGARLPS